MATFDSASRSPRAGGANDAGQTDGHTILLAYGLFRPGSVEFSLAFVVAPLLALLWTVVSKPTPAERRVALWVTWGTIAGAVTVVLVNWFRQ